MQRWRPVKVKHYFRMERDQRRVQHAPAEFGTPEADKLRGTARRNTLLGDNPNPASAEAAVGQPVLSSPTVPVLNTSTLSMHNVAATATAATSAAVRRSSKTTTMLLDTHTDLNAALLSPRDYPAHGAGYSGQSFGIGSMSAREPRERAYSDLSTTGTVAAAMTPGRRASVNPASMLRSSVCVSEDHLSAQLFAAIPELKVLVSCGHWDHSFRVTSVDSGKQVQVITQHSDVVTCAAYARDFSNMYVATGSRDCTVMVWEVNADFLAQGQGQGPLKSQPLHILYGHDDAVTCVSINPEFDVVVSGSDDGTVMVHSLCSGVYIRSVVISAVNVGGAGALSASGAVPPYVGAYGNSSAGSGGGGGTNPTFSNNKAAIQRGGSAAAHAGNTTPVASIVDVLSTDQGDAVGLVVPVAAAAAADELVVADSMVVAVPTPRTEQALGLDDAALAMGPAAGSIPALGGGMSGSAAPAGSSSFASAHRRVTWVGISREAYIVVYCADDQLLVTYAINGDLLAYKVVPERLYALVLSEDGKVLVTGGDSCLVVLRWVS
jgi:WD40 repeat protein